MNEAVDGGDGDGSLWGCGVPTAPQGIREDAFPGAEWLVGGDGEAAMLVAPGDQLEEDGALGLVLLRVGDVVVRGRGDPAPRGSEDQEVELVELGPDCLTGGAASRTRSRRAAWSFCTRSPNAS